MRFLQYHTTLLYTLLLLSCFSLQAQEQLWQIDLSTELNQISWIEQANNGSIIAAGDKGLMGINPADGSTTWHLTELKAVDRNSFFNVEGLPLFYLEYSPLVGKKRGLIINSGTGDILYDTKDDELRIKTYTFLPEQNSLLFQGINNDIRYLVNFDLNSLEANWKTAVGEYSGLVGRLRGAAAASFIDHGPMTNQAGDLILGIKDKVYAIDYATG